MFRKKKHSFLVVFDSEAQSAVLKCSICNGERVAGFKDKATGYFTEVAYIRNDEELDAFMKHYGLTAIAKEY